MKALQISQYGNPTEVVQLVDIPEPAGPANGEVLAAVEYAPINFSEVLKILGQYPLLPSTLPATVGNEGVARIVSLGRDVKGLKPGDRILVPFTIGAWSERVVLPADGLAALPSNADPRQLSMLSINPPTAALMLSDYVELSQGDWVLQNAGNSGVGRSVIAIAKSRGLRTASIVRRAEVVDELVDAGGDAVLVDGPDLGARIKAATKNAGIPLAIDGVGGESSAVLVSALARGGTLVVYSRMSRKPISLDAVDLIFRDIRVRAFWLPVPEIQRSPRLADALELGAKLIAEGRLKVPIAATYRLTEGRAALGHALQGGKVLFQISE